jgi:hypothetical protein
MGIPVSRSPAPASNPASGTDGDFDVAWILARYMRTVSGPLMEEEGYLTDASRLENDLRNRLLGWRARRSAGTDEIADSLMQWCATAESKGIQALRAFVIELRTYTMHGITGSTVCMPAHCPAVSERAT